MRVRAHVFYIFLCVLSAARALAGAPTTIPVPEHPGQSVTLLSDGRILITGGAVDNKTSTAAYLVDTAGTVQALKQGLLVARKGHTATALPDGTVLVFGGTDEDGHYVRSMEIFDPQALQFSRWQGVPLVPRFGHTTTLLTDGRVVVIGGTGEGGAFPTDIQFWDFRTGAVQSVDIGPLISRQGHTAVLQANGLVLISGGHDPPGEAR